MTSIFDLNESLDHLPAKNKLFKFKGRVKELDREYEKQNNGELDNGVYNRNTESLLQSSRQTEDERIDQGEQIVNILDVSEFDQVNIGKNCMFSMITYRQATGRVHIKRIRISKALYRKRTQVQYEHLFNSFVSFIIINR